MLSYSDMLSKDSSSSSESSSDITLHAESDVPLSSIRRDSVTAWSDEDDDTAASQIFPFHLISGCSTAERGMCQYSRTITSHEVQGRIALRKGMYIRGRGGGSKTPTLFGRVRGGGSAVIAPRAKGSQHHATCRNHVHRYQRSQADQRQ